MFDWRIGRGAAGALLDHPISSSREGDYPSAAKAASIRASIGVGPNSELDPLRLGQMLNGEGALSLAFVKKAKDHFGATDVMAITVKLRVASNLGNKRLNRSNAQRIKS